MKTFCQVTFKENESNNIDDITTKASDNYLSS